MNIRWPDLHVSRVLRGSVAVLAGLTLLLLSACGPVQRAQLKKKATPPASKIYIEFIADPSLLQAIRDSATGEPDELFEGDPFFEKLAEQQAQQADVLAQNLTGNMMQTFKTDLLKNNIGFPTTDPNAETDLKLTGYLTLDTNSYVMGNAAMNWELIEVRSGAIIRAGRATGNPQHAGPIADQVLADLLSINVDVYAENNGNRPTAASASGDSVDDPPASATRGDDAWAVVIGIENYRDELTPATHAEADAKVFAQYAEKTLGVPPSHIKLLINDRAGRADISSAIEEWLPRNAVKPGGKVYIFFSGHGAPDVETGDAYLVPYDADPAYLKTRGYAVRRVFDTTAGLKNQQVFVFLDSCFSGSGDRSVLAQGTRPLVPVKAEKAPEGVISFAASAASQTTGASGQSGHGLFTHHLLTGLQGAADSNGDRNITLDELVKHVTLKVTEEARLQNREQSPTLTMPVGMSSSSITVINGLK